MKDQEVPVYRAQLTNLVSAVVKRVKTKREQSASPETKGTDDNGKCRDSQKTN